MRILFATAGVRAARETADDVVRIAGALGGELVVLHNLEVGAPPDYGNSALEVFSQAGAQAGVTVEKILEKTDVVTSIVQSAKDHDIALIVMGVSHGLAPHQWLSTQVQQQVDIPVVVLPHATPSV